MSKRVSVISNQSANGTYPSSTGAVIAQDGIYGIELGAASWDGVTTVTLRTKTANQPNFVTISTAVFTADNSDYEIALTAGTQVVGVVANRSTTSGIYLDLVRRGQ